MPKIIIYAKSGDGLPLIESTISAFIGDVRIGYVENSGGRGEFSYADPPRPVRVLVQYPNASPQERTLAAGEASLEVSFTEIMLGGGLMDFVKQNLPAAVGLVLLAISIVLGFVFPHPEPTQIFLIRATFALGAGGVGSIIPGLLNANVTLGTKLGITAGGALAVLVLMFLFDPGDGSRSTASSPGASTTAPAGNATGNAAAPAGNATTVH